MTTRTTFAGLIVLTLLFPSLALAQPTGEMEYRASVYGFFPDIGGAVRFPTGSTRDINVNAGTLLDNTRLAAMGAFELQKNRWGGFADFIYMNISTTKTATRDLAIASVPLPVTVTADADVDIKAPVMTLAVNYRVASTPVVTFDLFGGARFLAAKAGLDWQFSADVGGLGGPSRQGTSEAKNHVWDGIGGAKGRIHLGSSRLFIPFYVDLGAGESDFTWQALGGAGVAFGWGEILAGWRYLDYSMKADRTIDTLNFNGPVTGVAFRW